MSALSNEATRTKEHDEQEVAVLAAFRAITNPELEFRVDHENGCIVADNPHSTEPDVYAAMEWETRNTVDKGFRRVCRIYDKRGDFIFALAMQD